MSKEWVGHWTNYKVFHDNPDMNIGSDEMNISLDEMNISLDDINISPDEIKALAIVKEEIYCEELENEENFEHDAIDSNEIIIEDASIHNLKAIIDVERRKNNTTNANVKISHIYLQYGKTCDMLTLDIKSYKSKDKGGSNRWGN